jgi:hypothetical protein
MKVDPSAQLHIILLPRAEEYPSLLLVLSVILHKRHFYISNPFLHCAPFSSSLVRFVCSCFYSAKAVCVHNCSIVWQLFDTASLLNMRGVYNGMLIDGNVY